MSTTRTLAKASNWLWGEPFADVGNDSDGSASDDGRGGVFNLDEDIDNREDDNADEEEQEEEPIELVGETSEVIEYFRKLKALANADSLVTQQAARHLVLLARNWSIWDERTPVHKDFEKAPAGAAFESSKIMPYLAADQIADATVHVTLREIGKAVRSCEEKRACDASENQD
ncbi:hypothetical protein HDU87_008561 [Geranomyces variabilis]|uniref:Uncharacterized protein n=1 Tax=Geranomyces variabilis TaxID=109894 RepID=A0AAD5TTS1_9FUNG|nr:hypothetical protein HDU87_008561 [Geranomyces variabilis]